MTAAATPPPVWQSCARTPVLLVPGWSDTARVLRPLRSRFIAAGWPEDAVGIVDFHDRHGGNEEHAEEIMRALELLRARTGAARADVVAHSMGGLALRLCLRETGHAACVRRVVFLATPHSGTWAAWLAWGDGGREMRPGSAMLRRLGESQLPGHVRGWTLRTPIDLRIIPGASARLDGLESLEVCCPTHRGLLRSARVFSAIADALTAPDPAG